MSAILHIDFHSFKWGLIQLEIENLSDSYQIKETLGEFKPFIEGLRISRKWREITINQTNCLWMGQWQGEKVKGVGTILLQNGDVIDVSWVENSTTQHDVRIISGATQAIISCYHLPPTSLLPLDTQIRVEFLDKS